MTDWADDTAGRLYADCGGHILDKGNDRFRLTAALRKARIDALEEAVDLVWEKKHWLGYDLVAEINALKVKP